MAATLALLAFALAAPPEAAPAPRPVGVDGDGFPLPEGAMARLGTARFHHPSPVLDIAWSPDGTTLAAAAFGHVTLWDAATGRTVRRVERAGVPFSRLAFTPDGKRLYAVGGTAKRKAELVTFEAATGAECGRAAVDIEGGVGGEFSADRGRVLVVGWPHVPAVVLDVATGAVLARIPGATAATFTPDGRRLVVGAAETVAVIDAATGKRLDPIPTPARHPGLVRLSADGATAYLRTPNAVERWDVAKGKAVWKREWLASGDDLAVSADGTRLAAAGLFGIDLLDARTGEVVARTPTGVGGRPTFRPDGKVLAVVAWPGTITLWDAATGKPLPQSPELPEPVEGLRFSPDGRRLFGRTDDGWVAWDATGQPPDPRPTRPARTPTLSPDGRLGVRPVSNRDDGPVEFFDPATGKGRCGFAPPETRRTLYEEGSNGLFDRGGRRFFGRHDGTRGNDGVARDAGLGAWDVETGKRIAALSLPGGDSDGVSPLAVAADGRVVVALVDSNTFGLHVIAAWEPDTQRVRWARRTDPYHSFLAFAAGDTRVVLQSVPPPAIYGGCTPMALPVLPPGPFVVLDAATGKEVDLANGPPIGPPPVSYGGGGGYAPPTARAVSPDGRVAAASGYDGTIYLWDLATDRERGRFAHPGPVASLAFAPDGRTLAAVGAGGPVLLFDVWGTAGRPPTPADLAAAWRNLGAADPWAGFRGVRAFAAAGGDGVAALRREAAAVRWPDAAAVARLVADLDAADFPTRTRADAELRRVAGANLARLQAARAAATPEAGRRLAAILDASLVPSGEGLRAIRTVETAEVIGSPAALAALDEWAKGDGPLAREAKAAAGRLRGRPPAAAVASPLVPTKD